MCDTVVSTENGKVQGVIEKSRFSGVKYYAFYGIPYGQPPIDDLQYKDPVKANPWKCIRDATAPRQGCIQFSMQYLCTFGSEDCLYVNIQTPQLPSNTTPRKAVIVNIHPGGNLIGSPDPGQEGSPNFIMHCDIVYVSVCYRLHFLGFLNLGIEECPGNQGLKDIILALRWIQSNIHEFNGDPNNVTLLGNSSGAGLIHCLMLSPKAQGLFHKAVMMSGYLFNCTVYEPEEDATKRAKEFGKFLGFRGNNPKRILKFIKLQPIPVLLDKMLQFHKMKAQSYAPAAPCCLFAPSIDKGPTSVLPKSPVELIPDMNTMPVMIGICELEAIMAFLSMSDDRKHNTEKYFKTAYQQNCWGWAHGLSQTETEFAYQQIESFYFEDDPRNRSLVTKINILTDGAFSDLYDTLIDVNAAKLPKSTFVYKFEYEGEVSAITNAVRGLIDGDWKGSVHADDYSHWCDMIRFHKPETAKVIRTFTKLVGTFAKTSNPTIEEMSEPWKPSTLQNRCYLRITDTLNMVEGRLNGERMEFWQNLKKQLNRERIIKFDRIHE